jgi:hypothetical protein
VDELVYLLLHYLCHDRASKWWKILFNTEVVEGKSNHKICSRHFPPEARTTGRRLSFYAEPVPWVSQTTQVFWEAPGTRTFNQDSLENLYGAVSHKI